jgi:hypothetical protein
MRIRPCRRKALSLIEVLAAMAIFLMSLVALVHLVNTSANLAAETFHRSRCSLLCQSKMALVVSGAVPLQTQSDTACTEDSDYNWSLDVQPGTAQGLSVVTVRVSYKRDASNPIEVSFARFVLDPTTTGNTQDVPISPTAASSATTGNTTGSGTTGMGN